MTRGIYFSCPEGLKHGLYGQIHAHLATKGTVHGKQCVSEG